MEFVNDFTHDQYVFTEIYFIKMAAPMKKLSNEARCLKILDSDKKTKREARSVARNQSTNILALKMTAG